MTALVRTNLPLVAARANWGRWVVDCPRCPSARWFTPGMPEFTCLDCGMQAEVIWPPPDMVSGVERLLMMRPNVATRNWLHGESLHDLLQENLDHGLASGEVGDEMLIVGDRIVLDTLPATPFIPAIGA